MVNGDGSGITDLRIEEEVKESYLTYAMSVLVDRALPDLRDGLKPVHRRILQTCRDLGINPGTKPRKCAKIVGDCMGNYHPHGNLAIYDALVRMAQDFSLRYPVIDGQGNFGSIDGDPAAAERYTEARMAVFGSALLEDIQYDTVDHRPNYDGSQQEPTVLPSRLPNLLVNGSSGIAVGMATNIPSHNLREVCGAITHCIDHPACTVADLMQFIKAPDFPTGGQICGTAGVHQAYETGNGKVVLRAKVHTEEVNGRTALVVTEIPYGIKAITIRDSIKAAHDEERVKGLHSVVGGAQGDGLRLVIELKKGEDPDLVLNQLWQHTSLQYGFAINLVALDHGRPRTVGLKRMIQAWIEHRIVVIVRKTRFLLARDEARLHIILGLLKAIDHIDAIITLIRAAESVDQARSQLMERFAFSQLQAQAILDMQLRRLTGLERGKLDAERIELETAIADHKAILASPERQYAIIKADLAELSAKYGDDRKSEIVAGISGFAMEDLIEDEPCVVTLTASGYLKRVPVDTYRVQRRGGKGVTGSSLKDDDDHVARMFVATNHQHLLVFTSLGRLHWLKVYEVPAADRTARGKHLANLLPLGEGESISEVVAVRDFPEDHYLLMATANGTVKKTALALYGNPRQGGIKAIKLDEGDRLVGLQVTFGEDEVLLAASDGQAVRFHESDCRPMGRDTTGVAGMDLGKDAKVVSLVRLEPGTEVLTVCANGFGKRTSFLEYRLTRRGGKGVINIDTSERNGAVIASLAVRPGDGLLLMTRKGQVVRTSVDSIRSTGRAAQGVTIIGMDDGDTVTGVALCPRDDLDETAKPNGTPAPAPSPAVGDGSGEQPAASEGTVNSDEEVPPVGE